MVHKERIYYNAPSHSLGKCTFKLQILNHFTATQWVKIEMEGTSRAGEDEVQWEAPGRTGGLWLAPPPQRTLRHYLGKLYMPLYYDPALPSWLYT